VSDYNKLREALELARQMDEQQSEEGVDPFLDVISQVESSGGTNLDHKMIKSGMHKGDRAVGKHALMPNTVKETAVRMDREGRLSDKLRAYSRLDSAAMKEALENDPEASRIFSEELASKVLSSNDDDRKAAYGWFQGHNKTQEEIEQERYQDHDYVEKYDRFKKMLKNGKLDRKS